MGHPLFAPAPRALGLYLVSGAIFLGVGYAFLAHPRRVFVWRHPLDAEGPESAGGTTVALYQAWGFLLAVIGTALWTLLALGDTAAPPSSAVLAGGAVTVTGLLLARTDSRRWQDRGVAAVVAGLGLVAGGGLVIAAL